MKTAYLGKIQLSDVDLSYLREAQRLSDVTYILEITPRFSRGPAFCLPRVAPRTGIFKATELYPEFQRYASCIDLDRFYVANTSGRFWQLKAFWTNFLLLLFLIRGGFNVIHVTWPPNIYEFVLYFLRRRMLLTVHDPFPHTGLDTFIVRLRRKFAFKFIPKFILLNHAQKSDFCSFYKINPNRVTVSSLSCYAYLQSVSTTALAESSPYVLSFGKISPYKGIDYLLPAMVEAHKHLPNLKLIVAGSGKYPFDTSPYEGLPFIELRNRFIPDEELVSLIRGAMFVVCPYTDATQSGVIMSAFAFNKPVLATNVGGLPEMVENGRFGRIIPEKNTEALADAIVEMGSNADTLRTYSENIAAAYQRGGEKSWQTIAAKLLQEYSQCANVQMCKCANA